jgi:hypothetical protein
MVFNNIDNKHFGRSIESFNIEDFITCRSYGLNMRFQTGITTDYTFTLKEFTASVEKAFGKFYR